MAPLRLQKLLAAKLPQFQKLCGAYETVNPNIPETLDKLGLTAECNQSAERYLLNNGISPEFLKEVVHATTRAWLADDLEDLNGLAALEAMNPADTDYIQPFRGGNYNLVYRLLKLSEVKVRLNTRVSRINRSQSGSYHLTAVAKDLADSSSTTDMEDYDAIIIATPLQGAGVDLDLGVDITETLTPYVERHVTHFTSQESDTLSTSFFNVSHAEEIPDKIFTARGMDPGPGFFSIDFSLADLGLDGCVVRTENLYKIVSATPLEDSMIAELLGKPKDSTLEEIGVRWVHRQAWPYASPKFRKGAMLDNIELADGIFYTGAGEEVVSSLEMSCRMGRLAADLFYYSLLEIPLEP